MSRRRSKRKPQRAANRDGHGTRADRLLADRLVAGARIDLGDVVVSNPDHVPSYVEGVLVVDRAMEGPIPTQLGFDPFAKLRLVRPELEALVEEVDDWIRVGNHVRIKTLWRLPNPALGISRTDHMAEWDDLPSDWAHRTARIIADLRSQLDNLVFDLVTRAAGRELEEREAAALSFPVDEDQRPLSAASLAKRVGFLTDAARVVILEAQPSWHDAGMDYRRSTLWQLNKLNNLDKHRTMNVAATAQVVSRGDESKVFAEGEILIAAPDFWGEGFCDEGCVYDATVTYGSPGAEWFVRPDGKVEPMVGLCRFLRMAYALVGDLTIALVNAELTASSA